MLDARFRGHDKEVGNMVGKWFRDVPFPKHRKYYIGLKIAILAIAALLALYIFRAA